MNDPINLVDPSGNIPIAGAILIGGLGVGAIQATGALLSGGSASQVAQAFATGFVSGAVGVGLGAVSGIGAILAIHTGLIVDFGLNLPSANIPDFSNGINKINQQIKNRDCSSGGN